MAVLATATAWACGPPPDAPPAGAGGGSGGEVISLPPERPLSVWLEPEDGRTATGDARVAVGVAGAPDPSLLEDLAARVTLVTWPELAEVAASVEPRIGQSTGVRVEPSAPLAARWYALRVSSLPPALRFSSLDGTLTLADGSVVSRFHPAPLPRLWRVDFCSIPGGTKARVEATEVVHAEAPAGSLVQLLDATFSAIACEATQQPTEAAPLASFTLACEPVPESASLTLRVRPGFVASTGEPMGGVGDHPLTLASLPETAEGCRRFTAPVP